jgi:hypothetical protein
MFREWDADLTKLKELFVYLASRQDTRETWVSEAELETGKIKLEGTPDDSWRSILEEAGKQGKVMSLINVAISKYGESKDYKVSKALKEAKQNEEKYQENHKIEVNEEAVRSNPLSPSTTNNVSNIQQKPSNVVKGQRVYLPPDVNNPPPPFPKKRDVPPIMLLPAPDVKKLLPALSLSPRYVTTIFPLETPQTLEDCIRQVCENYAQVLQASKSLTSWLQEFHVVNSDVTDRKSISAMRCRQLQKDLQELSSSLKSECQLFEMNQPLRAFLMTDAQALFRELSYTFQRLDPLLAKVKALMHTDAKSTVRSLRQAIETGMDELVQQLVKIDILMLPVLPERADKGKIQEAIYLRYTATDFALFCQKLLKDVFKCSDSEYNRIMAQQDEKKILALLDYCQSRGFYTKLLFCLIKDPYFREVLQEIVRT